MEPENNSNNNSNLKQQEEQNLVMFTFEGNVKHVSQAGVIWTMENLVKRGDILAIVSLITCERAKIRASTTQKLSTNQELREKEEMQMKRRFPGLAGKCRKEGVTLVMMEKVGELEVTICREAMKLHAHHVVLDRSLKSSRRREFYQLNFSCGVTRMRKSGGVDIIRASLEGRSSTSVKTTPPLPLLKRSKGLRCRKLQDLRSFVTADEGESKSSSIGMLTASRFSSESSVTVSSNPNGGDDDDLVGVVHVRARHMEIDTSPCSLGYESDDLFSLGTGSTRHSEIDSELVNSRDFFSSDYEGEDLFSIETSSALP